MKNFAIKFFAILLWFSLPLIFGCMLFKQQQDLSCIEKMFPEATIWEIPDLGLYYIVIDSTGTYYVGKSSFRNKVYSVEKIEKTNVK